MGNQNLNRYLGRSERMHESKIMSQFPDFDFTQFSRAGAWFSCSRPPSLLRVVKFLFQTDNHEADMGNLLMLGTKKSTHLIINNSNMNFYSCLPKTWTKVSFTYRCTSKQSYSKNLTSLFPLIFLTNISVCMYQAGLT